MSSGRLFQSFSPVANSYWLALPWLAQRPYSAAGPAKPVVVGAYCIGHPGHTDLLLLLLFRGQTELLQHTSHFAVVCSALHVVNYELLIPSSDWQKYEINLYLYYICLYIYIYIHIYCMLVYLDMYCEHVACRRPCERELSSVVSPWRPRQWNYISAVVKQYFIVFTCMLFGDIWDDGTDGYIALNIGDISAVDDTLLLMMTLTVQFCAALHCFDKCSSSQWAPRPVRQVFQLTMSTSPGNSGQHLFRTSPSSAQYNACFHRPCWNY